MLWSGRGNDVGSPARAASFGWPAKSEVVQSFELAPAQRHGIEDQAGNDAHECEHHETSAQHGGR